MSSLSFSQALAVFTGIITLSAEVVRRRQQLLDAAAVPLWMDDALLAVFLLYGAWRIRSHPAAGRAVLAAAWGFMCGLNYYGLFDQLLRPAASDPSSLVPVWVTAVKGAGLALGIVGMVTAMMGKPDAGRR